MTHDQFARLNKVRLAFPSRAVFARKHLGIGSLEWSVITLDASRANIHSTEIKGQFDYVCIVLVFTGSMIPPWVERLYDVRFGYFVKRFRFPPISIDLGARNSLWDSFVLGFRFVSFRVVWHTRFKVQLLHTWNHSIFSSPTKCLRLIRYCNSSMN